jgi:hypothetical protein
MSRSILTLVQITLDKITKMTAGSLVDELLSSMGGFHIDEPPSAASELEKRQDDMANLLATFKEHLQERSAHSIGKLFTSLT